MTGLALMIGLIVSLIALIGTLVYLVSKAAVLKATADSLQQELKQFKEGGFDQLVREKLELLTAQATRELQTREQIIQQTHTKLLEGEQKATAATKQFQEDFGKVSTQLAALRELQGKVSELNDLLKPQQFRGELGEVIVRNLIADKLPPGQYEENYTFSDGKQVEFVIRLNNRLIAVDSKLPLDDYKRMQDSQEQQRAAYRTEFKRTLKKKIDEVKAYIRPEEGTYNFALMVIPSEAVYYDVVANKDFLEEGGLYEYARARNVFLTSPNVFWAYLTAIAHGLRGLEIERHAEQILLSLQTLATQIRSFSQDEFRKLGSHLKDAANKYDEADRKLRDVNQGLEALERVEAAPLIR